MSYKTHSRCRACGYGPMPNPGGIKSAQGNELLAPIMNLGVLPLPNSFRKDGDSIPGHYPVHLLACPKCHLGQLSAVVDPRVMYSNYPYITSASKTMLAHFESLTTMLKSMCSIKTVVEIGSNDGLFLSFLKSNGAETVMGIDPAANLVQESKLRGVDAVCGLFNETTARIVIDEVVDPVDLIVARHVFCHVDDWMEFMRSVEVMSNTETTVCIEAPWAHETIENCEWDQVYAEHLSYLTVRSIEALLSRTSFRLHHVERFPVHGGAIVLILKHINCTEPQRQSVQSYLAMEDCSIARWRQFASKAQDQITNLKLLVSDLTSSGKRIAGYGASAKSTMWINVAGFKRMQIQGVYDNTPQKWYTMIPGTDIPVIHEGAFYVDNPDYAIVWAWNFIDEIVEKQKKWIEGGGRFIVPVPEVKILQP